MLSSTHVNLLLLLWITAFRLSSLWVIKTWSEFTQCRIYGTLFVSFSTVDKISIEMSFKRYLTVKKGKLFQHPSRKQTFFLLCLFFSECAFTFMCSVLDYWSVCIRNICCQSIAAFKWIVSQLCVSWEI